MLISRVSVLTTVLMVGMLVGCGKSDVEESTGYDNTLEVEAYYRDNPERFVYSSIDKLPGNLEWQDGSELPTFGDPRAKRGGQLTLRVASMQQTLRVLGPDANGSLRAPLWSANSVGLIERHPWKDGYTPGLAQEWAVDPDDSRTIYFKLDPDARWSDGKPVTMEDFFFSLYFLLSPNLQGPAVSRVIDENFRRITRFDAETFSLTQSKNTPETLFGVSGLMIAQRDFYREFGPDYVDRYHWRFAPVTGPYVLDEDNVKRGRQITFERIENWWADTKPFYQHRFNPDKMRYVVIRDDDKAFEAFLVGDIDWFFMNRTALWYDHVEAPPIRNGYIELAWVYHQLPAASEGIHMNSLDPLLSKRNLRLGIQHALNFAKVNEGLYRGDRRRINTYVDGYGSYSHPTLRARPFDPVKAAEYFNEEGFTERDSDGILVDASGQRLSFVLTIENRTDEITPATILKEEAKTAGLELILEVLDSTAYFTKTFEKKHQMTKLGWSSGYSPIPTFEWELRGEDAGKPSNFNTTNINDDQLNALLVEWDTLTDPELAYQVSYKVQESIHDFAAWVPGLTTDYTRLGYWRWVRWPEYFQIPRYFFYTASGVFWIDDARKQETNDARDANESLTAKSKIYERWK
jgi:microcin C transport system substrate-binding protein